MLSEHKFGARADLGPTHLYPTVGQRKVYDRRFVVDKGRWMTVAYEGWCKACQKCPACKGSGTIKDRVRGRITCKRCGGVGGFPCARH